MLDIAAIWRPEVQQRNYRAILNAFARPGQRQTIDYAGKESAVLAVLATLLDKEVSLADPDSLIAQQEWPLLQAQRTATADADFIVCRGNQAVDFCPQLGTLTSPEKSATLIIVIESLVSGEQPLTLTGPGVETSETCALQGLHPSWLAQRKQWIASFPMGVDLLLVDERQLLALPRTTHVELG